MKNFTSSVFDFECSFPGSVTACLIAGAIAASSAQAASVSWGSARDITADADVSLNGTLVRAANTTLPSDTSEVMVNGVNFAAVGRPQTAPYIASNGDIFLPVDTSSIGPGTAAAFGGNTAPFNALSTGYQSLLSSAYWNDGTDSGTTWSATASYDWTLSNLSIGQKYELQVWVSDYRLRNLAQDNPDLYTTVSDGVTGVNLQHNVQNALGGMGQYVIGTFTADATSQALRLIGGNTVGADTVGANATSLINAYQLRAVPEPGALGLAGLAVAGLVFSRRRN